MTRCDGLETLLQGNCFGDGRIGGPEPGELGALARDQGDLAMPQSPFPHRVKLEQTRPSQLRPTESSAKSSTNPCVAHDLHGLRTRRAPSSVRAVSHEKSIKNWLHSCLGCNVMQALGSQENKRNKDHPNLPDVLRDNTYESVLLRTNLCTNDS